MIALPATTRRITTHLYFKSLVGMAMTYGSPAARIIAACAQFHVSHEVTTQTLLAGMHGQRLPSSALAATLQDSNNAMQAIRLIMIQLPGRTRPPHHGRALAICERRVCESHNIPHRRPHHYAVA